MSLSFNVFNRKPFTLGNLTDRICKFNFIHMFVFTDLITSPRMRNLCFGIFFPFFFPYLINKSSPFLYFEHFLLFQYYSTVLSQYFLLALFAFSLSSSTRFLTFIYTIFRWLDNFLYIKFLFSFNSRTPHFTISFESLPS